MYRALIRLMTFQFTIIQILFKSKNDLVLETIELRQQLATENFIWGALRIYSELLKLGYTKNHRQYRMGMDFFTVPTEYGHKK
jgi:hypothetical protein